MLSTMHNMAPKTGGSMMGFLKSSAIEAYPRDIIEAYGKDR